MKNSLSENMLRFGTKNLSEAAQRELVLKSIMETINEHGLHKAVKRQLMEQGAPADAAWLTTAKDKLAGENANGNFLSNAILKVGAAYTQADNEWALEIYGSQDSKKIAILAKGSKWYASPSLTVMWCPCTIYTKDQFGGTDMNTEILNNPNALQQLVNGTYKYNGKVVKGIKSNVVWYPSLPNTLVTGGGTTMQMGDGTWGRTMSDSLTHQDGQPYGPGAGTKYEPGS